MQLVFMVTPSRVSVSLLSVRERLRRLIQYLLICRTHTAAMCFACMQQQKQRVQSI